LGGELGSHSGDIVLDGDPALPPEKGHSHPLVFGPRLLGNSRKAELPLGTGTDVV